jgi:Domain of unknown function (DUF4129)
VSRSPAPGRGGRRDLALPAVGLAALLAVVGVASAARLGGGEGGGGRLSLPEGVFAYIYAGFVVAGALAFPFFLYVSTRTAKYERGQRRRAWLAPLWLAGIVGVLLALRATLGDGFGGILDRLSIGADTPDLPSGARGGAPPAPETVPVAAILVLAGGSIATFFVLRAARRHGKRLPGGVSEELTAFVDTTLDDLRAEPDARVAIVRAYARMERTCEHSGVPRDGSEAPLEYVARVLLELDVRPGPVNALTDLFERAKFSTHDLGDDAKGEAIAALEDIRADLTPAPEDAS